MSSYLLSIGNAAGRMLPAVFTALSCGAAVPVPSLSVFCLAQDASGFPEAEALAESFTKCHALASSPECPGFFPSAFSMETCTPAFRSVRELCADPDAALLIAALRGRGLPLSCHTDREAVEWCFADLLSRPEDPSIQSFFAWLDTIRKGRTDDGPARLALLADLSDPFSAGIAAALLSFLRNHLEPKEIFLSLIAAAETASPVPEAFFPSLRSSLQALEERSLLRSVPEDPAFGADTLWFLSLPSSMVESPDSHLVTALSAARIIGKIHGGETLPPLGFHTREIDGTLSVSSLRDEAPAFAAFLQSAAWLLSDLFPALRSYIAHPARLRSLAVNPRNTVLRTLFASPKTDVLPSLDTVEQALRSLLDIVLRFLRAVPASLRLSAENASLWQQAVNACGRYITVASELDTSTEEAKESGLDAVRPVHRVSLADTEEEQLARRLQDMQKQLDAESAERDRVLQALGGYRSLQVRLDCLSRCRTALDETLRKLASPPPGEERLEYMLRERRARLLRAAVSRCEAELTPEAVQTVVSSFPDTKKPADGPYAGVALTPESCRALEQLLQNTNEEGSVKIPPLFPDQDETDPKARMKTLAAACKGTSPSDPLSFLLARVTEICRDEISTFRFLSRGVMPSVPLLPDLFTESPLLRIKDVLALLPDAPVPEAETGERRGLLAMLLLRQYRRRESGESSLSCICCKPGQSPVLRYWLSSRRAEKVYALCLTQGERLLPYALALPGQDFIPAKRMAIHKPLVPSFAVWFDPDTLAFGDPCGKLGEGDRKLLLQMLPAYLAALPADTESPLKTLLQDFIRDLSRENAPETPDPLLKTRLRAVCGLSSLPAYQPSLTKVSCFYEHYLEKDSIGSCLTGAESFPPSLCTQIPEEVLYLSRGVPFARENSRTILESPCAAGEDYTLNRLKQECTALSESSDDYRDALLAGLQALLDRHPDALPEFREAASAVLDGAQKPVTRRDPVFTWPWDPKSPSVLTVLRESLGDRLSAAALDPFSDCLAVFPARGGEIIGDSLLANTCTILPRENSSSESEPSALQADAVLPPLSPSFGRALCTVPEGRTLLKPDFLRFERLPDESFRVTLTLDGVFPVHFVRDYTAEEVLHLYAHDIPTVALWPSVPFKPEDWKAYFAYAHLNEGFSVSACTAQDDWKEIPVINGLRRVSALSAFPVCFSLSKEDKTIGLVPNVLPGPLIAPADPLEICVDFGSSGTSVVFSSSRERRPMHGPVMVRTLLNNPAASRDLLRREFLPAVPVSALLPTVSRLFRNVPGEDPVPFEDGVILMPADLEDLVSTPSDAVYTSLKWEEVRGRSGFVCLHQVLLMAALQARFEGASALSWRFSLPDEMAKEGRESLMNLLLSLCQSVLNESGYPVPPEGLPVAFASDSSALGAYFRYCASDDTRGGFMVLDLGSCTADISLFLRGREQAVRTCQIPLGIHYMLLPSLLKDPEMLTRDFGFCPDEVFRKDLALLTRALSDSRTDPVAFRRARAALDLFIADHLPLLLNLSLQRAQAAQPAKSSSLLLLYFAYLMALSGLVLLQLASDPNRNDFLPEQMTLCLAGRGTALLEALPAPLKTSVWHFLSMFRNRRVASLALLFSAEKKMEIPVGLSLLQEVYHMLPPAPSVPASIAVRPSELLPEFLLRFRREFPASAEMLFPGFFTGDPYHPFTERGDSLIFASIDQSFPPVETPRPYDSLSAWIGNLLDLL